MVALLVFVIATLEFLAEKKNCWTQKVHLAVTFSDIFSYFSTVLQEVLNCVKWFIAMWSDINVYVSSNVVRLTTHEKTYATLFFARQRFERCTFFVASFTVALMMFATLLK